MFRSFIIAVFLVLTGLASAHAHDNVKGDMVISHSWARATVPSAKVGAGYMEIINEGKIDDRLIGASASFAGVTQIHQMSVENDVMRMRQVDGGIAVPAGGSVMLDEGGLHVMFMQLKQPLKEGEMHKVVLEFENAGMVEIELLVEAMGSKDAMGMKHADHDKMDAGDKKNQDGHKGHAH